MSEPFAYRKAFIHSASGLEFREQEGVMASGTVVRKLDRSAVKAPKAVPVKKTHSPEFLAEQEAVMARVREEGEKRIHRSVERAIAMGIIDNDGNLLKNELPADMQAGADRDFGG
jgi:hypothetical protein